MTEAGNLHGKAVKIPEVIDAVDVKVIFVNNLEDYYLKMGRQNILFKK